MAPFWAFIAPRFNIDANPDPGPPFGFDADPNPDLDFHSDADKASQNDADPFVFEVIKK